MAKIIFLLVVSLMMLNLPIAFANTIDLVTNAVPGTTVAAGDGTYWKVIDTAPTGTGLFDPFLRLDANTNQNNFSLGTNIEVGLNTNAKNPGVYNDVGSPHTHAVLWSNVGTITISGDPTIASGTYYQFTLDINEPNNSLRFLSLTDLKIYAGATDNATNINQLGNPLYNIGTTIPPVMMDYSIASSGSGEADIEFFIPTSKFSLPAGMPYMYFYNVMGDEQSSLGGKYGAQAGFEEWRVLSGNTPVPEPSTLLLLGSGLIGLWGFRKKFKK